MTFEDWIAAMRAANKVPFGTSYELFAREAWNAATNEVNKCEQEAGGKVGKERMVEILKSRGIEMKVDGCGCCDSPWVTFEYNGEIIFDKMNASFDTGG